jgi:hypothetical protein
VPAGGSRGAARRAGHGSRGLHRLIVTSARAAGD